MPYSLWMVLTMGTRPVVVQDVHKTLIGDNHATLVPSPHLPTHMYVTLVERSLAPVLVPMLCLPTLGATLEYHQQRYCLDKDVRMWVRVW